MVTLPTNLKGITFPAYCGLGSYGWLLMNRDGHVFVISTKAEDGGQYKDDIESTRIIGIRIPTNTSGDALNMALHTGKIQGLLNCIHAGHMVLDFQGTLDIHANYALKELQTFFDHFEGDLNIWEPSEWLMTHCDSFFDAWPDTDTLASATSRLKDKQDDVNKVYGSIADELLSEAHTYFKENITGLGIVHLLALTQAGLITAPRALVYWHEHYPIINEDD